MDSFIYVCLGLVLLAVVAGLWERSRRRKAEEQIQPLMKDLSAHRQSEDALRIRNEQLEALVKKQTRQIAEANRELEGFFPSISPDLRSPVRAIAGCAQIVRTDHGHKLDPEMAGLFDRIESNALRLGQLV